MPHDCVRISTRRDGVFKDRLRLAAATAVRDPISGFMITKENGVTVIVPESLSSSIGAALRRSPPRRVRITLSEQGEGLRWHSERNPESMDNLRPQHLPLSDPDSSKRQLLSDWELEMHFDGELLEVRLSAALFAAEPTHVWEKDHIGHWSVGNGIPSRIEIAFSVDLATRVAASHADYINTETQATESANPFSSTLSTLRLATAPIDTMGQVFGVMRNGQWATLETENGGILITPHTAKKRLANGFLLRDTGHRWPSVSLRVISIDTLLRPLWRERHVTLEMKDAFVGSLIQDREFHETYQPVPLQMIERAQLEFRVDIHGLQFSYRLYVTDLDVSQKEYKSGWLEDGMTIPWEIVILRFPEMLWHRKALLEELLP